MLHKAKAIDVTVLVIITLLALFYVYEVDVFVNAPGEGPKEHTIELDEALAVSALFCGGLTVFALRRLAEARRETARRLAAEREARTLAFQDSLTGLPNRRQFDSALKAALAAPPRAGASHALLLLDLNGFKRVNDVFGHPAGDELLIQIGARFARAVRDGDLVARRGGDEFAVLALQVSGAEAATGLALRIMESLAAPIVAGSGVHEIGVAIGVSLSPQDGSDPAELLREADIALYRAKGDKEIARSAVRFFEAGMDARVRERDGLERELRTAVAQRSIRPFYQPLVEAGRIIAFEALARWTSPTLGDVPPERFIALAEDIGVIGPLTDLLLEQACIDAADWPSDIGLSFNVSGALLKDRTFGLRVLATIGRLGISSSRLELEITESALVRDLDAAREILGGLRMAGVRIALDDFGTGYSSLYHLRNFKVDKIKIDRSFISSLGHDVDSDAIVRALVGLGAGLGLQVTAEGVETAEQERLLMAHGCGQLQGFRFSEAVAAAEAMAMLAEADRPSGLLPRRQSEL